MNGPLKHQARHTSLEICVDTLEGLEIAAACQVERIELCSCLSAGGLTPSPGMMQAAARLSCPTRAMIRPRDGDFSYSKGEVEMMLRDIDAVAEFGLEGVVIGANRLNGELDDIILNRLVSHAHAARLKVTLHRSFDLSPDLYASLAVVEQLGIDTVLTSGGALSAPEGIDALKDLVRAVASAEAPIELMAGVGVNAANAREIVDHTGVKWLHGSCSLPRSVVSSQAERLGYSSIDHRRTDAAEIERLQHLLSAPAQTDRAGEPSVSAQFALR